MKQDEYDVVIIGAGIGGLVCGCLLAKAGLKVLISEKTSKPGGYCTSFTVKNHEFDAFVHALGNLSENAQFYKILKTLQVLDEIDFVRFDPSDTIIAPHYCVSYWSSIEKTIDDFSRVFPNEAKQIDYFFRCLINEKGVDLVSKTKNKTFYNLLNGIFHDTRLKNTLALVILGNLGTPSTHINAFTAIKHYKQFMTDGGYYPRHGIQVLPDALAKNFVKNGGELFFSDPVIEICTKNKMAEGVKLRSGRYVNSRIVVSDCDARHTFLDLIDEKALDPRISDKMNSMSPSLSLFVAYLGYKQENHKLPPGGVNTWAILDYGFEEMHRGNIDYESEDVRWIMIRSDFSQKTCTVFAQAPFKSFNYWKENKKKYMTRVLESAEKIFPGLQESADFLNSSDPSTLNRWTMNFRGAGYGWAATPSQFMDPDFTRDKIIGNLLMCGHWSTIAQGIEGVAIVGERVANIILGSKTVKNHWA